jgi:hypothetical protein
MAAPIVSVPVAGPVGARPRREGLYDTEVFTAAGTTTTYVFFKNTSAFSDSAAAGFSGSSKTPGLDTNLVGNGGSVPRGHYLYVYGANHVVSRRQNRLQAFTNAAGDQARALEDKRMVIESAWWRFSLASTPYLDAPLIFVPAGVGMFGTVATTETAITVGDWQSGWPVRTNYFDLTVPGSVKVPQQGPGGVVMKEVKVPRLPIGLAETENFSTQINYVNRPSIVAAPAGIAGVFQQQYLVSIYLKPLSG